MTARHAPFAFPRAHRLRHRRQFDAVYGHKAARHAGPLRVYGVPNTLGFNRLGLSVSRRVGNAVMRNRIKRRLREAFRMLRGKSPAGYDLVVVVRRHEPMAPTEYGRLLNQATERLDRHFRPPEATGPEPSATTVAR